jgi:predicted nucleotidyltransferase
MENYPLTEEIIVGQIRQALEPLDGVKAIWLAGAAAFGRVDRWSDIDLMVVVDDDFVEEAMAQLEAALAELSPVELKYRLPQPTWHGHEQVFYRLSQAGPFLLIDAAIMKLSSQNKFLQPEIHGNPKVLFDKVGAFSFPPFDWEAHLDALQQRTETLAVLFELFEPFPLKELRRGNPIEALAYFHGLPLRFLVELLRIRHSPARHNFAARYIYYDLPASVVQRLESMYFIADPQDLPDRLAEAGEWFREVLAEIAESR